MAMATGFPRFWPRIELRGPVARFANKEATGRFRDKRAEAKASYLGIVVWHKELAGEISAETAQRILEELGQQGLDLDRLLGVYAFFKRKKMTISWLDLELQAEGLAAYCRALGSLEGPAKEEPEETPQLAA